VLIRKGGNALWHQVEQAIAQDILGGAFALGEKLPAEPALMARFGVSRFTIRQAIASLERQGLVRAAQGRGTFVSAHRLTYAISGRTRYSQNLIEQGFDPGGEVLSEVVVPAGRDIGERLHVPEWQSVVHRRGLGKANDVPIELADIFLPLSRFPDFPRRRAEHDTLTATFASYGVKDYLRASTLIEARMPSEDEARLLRQPIASPVFVVTRLDTELDGTPILYGRAVWCSDRVGFNVTERTLPLAQIRPDPFAA
jgi:GntR family phosphonate transport system transcriptional regulator